MDGLLLTQSRDDLVHINLGDNVPCQNLRPQLVVLNGVWLRWRQLKNPASSCFTLGLQISEQVIRPQFVQRLKDLALVADPG
ncbi:hypothetical protein AC630_35535 [Bradyrhizobium sp. AS23.2]|nr:hypothetical protein AC630_35535 [Bradyrhizobium sp. AS23.2]